MAHLLHKWQLGREISEGNPNDEEVSRVIINSTVSISGLRDGVEIKEFITPILTLGGLLPLGHHEVLCWQLPVHEGQTPDMNKLRGWMYIRWSTPQLAEICMQFIRQKEFHLPDGGKLWLHVGRPDTPTRIRNKFNRRPHLGQIRMYSWVWYQLIDDDALFRAEDEVD